MVCEFGGSLQNRTRIGLVLTGARLRTDRKADAAANDNPYPPVSSGDSGVTAGQYKTGQSCNQTEWAATLEELGDQT